MIAAGLRDIKSCIGKGEEVTAFFTDALNHYRDKLLGEARAANVVLNHWRARVMNDMELRPGHRRVMEFLLGLYDPVSSDFREIHFSELVKKARVSKRSAKEYMALLVAKGYVAKRSDGYRHYFRVAENTLC